MGGGKELVPSVHRAGVEQEEAKDKAVSGLVLRLGLSSSKTLGSTHKREDETQSGSD